jgi:predicted Zn-dependent protease
VLATSVFLAACSHSTSRGTSNGRNASPDEEALAAEADAEERRIREAGTVIEGPLLQPFLDAVAARLCVPFGLDASLVRVVAVRDPRENASVLPNGALIVYRGLLLRLENEAQLAGVLAHLLERFAGRHALEAHRSAKTSLMLGLLGGIVSPALFGNPLAAVEPHQRAEQSVAQILEADQAALVAMVAAGYDGEQMLVTMQALEPRTSESGPTGSTEAGYPPTAVRIARLSEQLAAMRADGRLGSDARIGKQEYAAAVTSALLVHADPDTGDSTSPDPASAQQLAR